MMKMMRYYLAVLFVLLSLAGCSQQSGTDMAVSDIAAAIMESQSELPALARISSEDDGFADWLTDYYFLSDSQVSDGVICYADGVEASEIAVLHFQTDNECKAAQKTLEEYILSRANAFEGYAPQQAAMAKQGIAVAVLQAWRSGDDSLLSEGNRQILDAAKAVIAEEIDDTMSDYEKELTIHDWITGWSSFDYSVFGRSSKDGFTPGSDTPYGVLIDRSAMCHGYSSTFQLFMDMLNIECITVFGTPGGNGVEHSWNMVKLDGEWYCVDTAWDDPIGGRAGHTYFNVTSEYLRKGSIHRWDDPSIPEAAGTKYAYRNP